MLYVINISSPSWRSPEAAWSDDATVYNVEGDIGSFVWSLQCEWADSYGGDQVDDEEYDDYVDRNTVYTYSIYDPTNYEHYMCSGAEGSRDTSLRDAYIKKERKEALERQIERNKAHIQHLKDEIESKEEANIKLLTELAKYE